MLIPLEKDEPPDDDWVDFEEDVPIQVEKERSPFSSGTTLDEFEAVVKVLKGSPLPHVEKKEAIHFKNSENGYL